MKFRIVLFLSSMFLIYACDDILSDTQTRTIDGTWYCQEEHEHDGNRNYYVDISYKAGDSSTIHIYNFLNLDPRPQATLHIYATVSGNSITIPRQKIEDHTVQGSGRIVNNSTINLSFTDDLYGGIPWQVTTRMTKY